MRRLGLVAALLLIVGALAACTITITYTAPKNPIATTASTSNANPVEPAVTVDPHSTVYFDVYVPSSVRLNYDVVYFELNANLDLTLIDYNSYAPMASSSSPSYFAPGTVAVQSTVTAPAVVPQAIGPNYSCQGSCIIWPTGSTNHYYLGVKNPTSSPVTFDLYVYGFQYQDPYEYSGNDSQSGATKYSGGAESGAIETLYDVDWWHITSGTNGTLTFSKVSSPIDLELVLRDGTGGYVDTYYIGGAYPNKVNVPFRSGDYLVIRSSNNYAGPPAGSRYDLNY